ncbi:MAG: YceI family protein [Bacteroidales bacterium]|nr:YceI family protein [Bacteroidales bacterium]
MKLKYLLLIAFSGLLFTSFAQKHITKTGTIEIFSETPVFTIEAVNRKVASILNTETGDVVASTLVRSFKFHEALVEEHFNENYMESHKFSKAIFKGKISNFESVDLTKDGSYDIIIEGKLTLHGETNYVKEKGILSIKEGLISAKTAFNVSLEAYKIKVEKAYKDAIKDDILLKIHFEYKPYHKK